ncbi:MAG: PHP domain-containing protein, partial [Bacteroidota bacterium]
MSIEELLQCAKENGTTHLALTDINNTSGCIDFMRHAPKYGIHPTIGIDFRKRTEQLYIGIANNTEGFRELNEFLTHYKMKHEDVPIQPPYLPNCTLITPWRRQTGFTLKENEWLGLNPKDISAFRIYGKKIPKGKLVMLTTVSFRSKKDFNTHRLLRAIYHNELLSKLPKTEQGNEEDKFINETELKKLYGEYPIAIEN